jgi:hypothetical protein
VSRRSPAPRRAVVAAVLALGVATLAGCGKPAGGDPGGRRLHELAADRVFSALPAGASRLGLRRTAAYYAKPGFAGGGWHGPSVTSTFTSPAREASVYGFYRRRARAAGWRTTKTNARGLPFTWTKTFPDGAPAYLSLLHLDRSVRGVPPHYILTGSI